MPSDARPMRRLILLSLAMAAVAPGASVAQDPTPTPAPTVLDIGSADDRMTVPVSIGNSGPFHFIVDTGAQRTVISASSPASWAWRRAGTSG